MKQTTCTILTTALAFSLAAQATRESMALYPTGRIPNAIPAENLETEAVNGWGVAFTTGTSVPTLTYFPAERPTGAAMIICPGGGYSGTATDHEGTQVAEMLQQAGIAAFVLRYRIPDDRYCLDRSLAPWQDAQRAIRLVRRRAGAWGLDPGRIGIMGFSAGGHLAATAATHFLSAADPTDRDTLSARPDFVALIYPVVSMREGVGHAGSRERLLGPSPGQAQVLFFSNELHVTADTPPAFLLHTQDDFVPVQNSLLFHAACLENGVPVEMHLFPQGGHGYGLRHPSGEGSWGPLLLDWIRRTAGGSGN